MSYSIIFEDKVILTKDGNYIHFCRSGCNNDTAGRKRDEFHADLYTPEEWEKHLEKYEGCDEPIKIGSKWSSIDDYAKHLRRMSSGKRILSFAQLSAERRIEGRIFEGIEFKPEGELDYIFISSNDEKALNDVYYGKRKGCFHRKLSYIKTEEEIVTALKESKHMSFYISKKYKR